MSETKVVIENRSTNLVNLSYLPESTEAISQDQRGMRLVVQVLPEDTTAFEVKKSEYEQMKPHIARYKKTKIFGDVEVTENDEVEEEVDESRSDEDGLNADNYKSSEDKDALIAFAATLDLEVDKRKAVPTIISEIETKLQG